MCNADESYARNPKYARSRSCACCGIAHELLAFLLFGALQLIVSWTVMWNCTGFSGKVNQIATTDVSNIDTFCKNSAYKDAGICKVQDEYKLMVENAGKFCNAQSSVIGVSVVSIFFALVLFFVAMVNACKCCEGCCGGKQKKNFINVIFSAVGFLIALVSLIVFLGLSSAYTQYKDSRADIFKAQGNSGNDTPLDGWSHTFFEPALTICVVWGFFLIVQRVVQGVFSFLASREEWKEREMSNIQIA